jgi:hypothetical protein
MAKLKWGDPPSHPDHERIDHLAAAAALRKRPARWANIGHFTSAQSSRSTAQTIRAGKSAAWAPKGAFEATARLVDGRYCVWARYVGEVR